MRIIGLLIATTCCLTACSSEGSGMGNHETIRTVDGGADQTPPMGASAVMQWLASGAYLKWYCESDVHEARAPSPHGYNRICSNDLLAGATARTGEWPAGAAAVKELHLSSTDDPAGYSVYLKIKGTSDQGASWYWYELYPTPNGDSGVTTTLVADGLGDSGPAKDICVGCHKLAGQDRDHTPSPGGRDYVYSPVAK